MTKKQTSAPSTTVQAKPKETVQDAQTEPTPKVEDLPAPAIFDVILLKAGMTEDDLPLPKNGPYYVITKTKTFIHKYFHFGRLLTKTADNGLPHLASFSTESWNGFLWHKIPPIPAGLIGQAWSFFQQIYKDLGTEAMVYITYHKELGYKFFIPQQWNTGGHVNSKFTPEHIKDGWQNIGTIHSHCNFSAFHSGTDHNDAKQQDGLHITIGHVNSDKPTFAVMIAAGGVNWDFKIEDVTVGNEKPELVLHPRWWERYVAKAEVNTASHGSSGYGSSYGTGSGYRPATNAVGASSYRSGQVWDPVTHKYIDPPKGTQLGLILPPSVKAGASEATTTAATASTEALKKKYNDLDGGYDPQLKMFKIGNDRYTGTQPTRLAQLMGSYGVAPPDWQEGAFLAYVEETHQEITAQLEALEDVGIASEVYFYYDPHAALLAKAWEETLMAELQDERDQLDIDEDDEDAAILPVSRSVHALTDKEIEELYH